MKYERSGYTGGSAEEEVLGRISHDYEKEFPREGEFSAEIKEGSREYFSFETMVQMVKEFQPNEDPSRPQMPFPKDLLATVSDNLGFKDGSRQIRYYTAVKSHLDRRGVDAFLELDLGGGRIILCPLDLTTNVKKVSEEEGIRDEGRKVVFHWPSRGISPKEDKKEWMDKINQIAEAAADHLRDRADEEGEFIKPLSDYELEESVNLAKSRREDILMRATLKQQG